jgi:hypothetical protein
LPTQLTHSIRHRFGERCSRGATRVVMDKQTSSVSPCGPMRLVILCINLDRATERWRVVHTMVTASGVPGQLVRLPATDGGSLSGDDVSCGGHDGCGRHRRRGQASRPTCGGTCGTGRGCAIARC